MHPLYYTPRSRASILRILQIGPRVSTFWLIVCCFTFSVSALSAGEYDWPQWRGPNRDDLSKETGLLKSWPEGGPKRLWSSDQIGLGYSGLAIVDNRVYIMGARNGVEQLLALDTSSGKEIWAADIGPMFTNDWGDGPRGTPTVDLLQGKAIIYALGAQGNLVCVRAADGEILWQRAMQDYGGKTPTWGYAESPLVYKDRVICTPGGEQGAIVALDKRSGQLLWQTDELTDTAHYTSSIMAEHGGRVQCIQLLPSYLVGVDVTNGSVLWKVPWQNSYAIIPTPIYHDGKVYVTSGYGIGGMLVALTPDNHAEEVYRNKVIKNHHGGVILLDGFLYGHSDRAGWICQNFLTGKQVWRERGALEKGAIGYADGRFYCLGEREGEVVLIEASPEAWIEHGRFTLAPLSDQRKSRGGIWTHPVISNGRLYLRDQEYLHCFDVKQ